MPFCYHAYGLINFISIYIQGHTAQARIQGWGEGGARPPGKKKGEGEKGEGREEREKERREGGEGRERGKVG